MSFRFNFSNKLNQIYSLTDVSVYYVLYDDSHILTLRNATFDGDSQVCVLFSYVCIFCIIIFRLRQLRSVDMFSFPSLRYDYGNVPLAVEVMEDIPRLAIGFLFLLCLFVC